MPEENEPIIKKMVAKKKAIKVSPPPTPELQKMLNRYFEMLKIENKNPKNKALTAKIDELELQIKKLKDEKISK